MNKIDIAIQRLNEFSLNSEHQKEIQNVDDGNIILGIVCDEVENE